MSGSGLLLIPSIATVRAAEQLRESIRLLPEPPALDGDPDPYGAALLREEPGALAGLVGALASAAESVRYGVLVAHHAASTPAALRTAGWTLEDRHAVNPIRTQLRYALTPAARAAGVSPSGCPPSGP